MIEKSGSNVRLFFCFCMEITSTFVPMKKLYTLIFNVSHYYFFFSGSHRYNGIILFLPLFFTLFFSVFYNLLLASFFTDIHEYFIVSHICGFITFLLYALYYFLYEDNDDKQITRKKIIAYIIAWAILIGFMYLWYVYLLPEILPDTLSYKR